MVKEKGCTHIVPLFSSRKSIDAIFIFPFIFWVSLRVQIRWQEWRFLTEQLFKGKETLLKELLITAQSFLFGQFWDRGRRCSLFSTTQCFNNAKFLNEAIFRRCFEKKMTSKFLQCLKKSETSCSQCILAMFLEKNKLKIAANPLKFATNCV